MFCYVKQKTADEVLRRLVGWEVCIRGRTRAGSDRAGAPSGAASDAAAGREAVASADRRLPSFGWRELEIFNACGDPRYGLAGLTCNPCGCLLYTSDAADE